jgi:hypothetical protein
MKQARDCYSKQHLQQLGLPLTLALCQCGRAAVFCAGSAAVGSVAWPNMKSLQAAEQCAAWCVRHTVLALERPAYSTSTQYAVRPKGGCQMCARATLVCCLQTCNAAISLLHTACSGALLPRRHCATAADWQHARPHAKRQGVRVAAAAAAGVEQAARMHGHTASTQEGCAALCRLSAKCMRAGSAAQRVCRAQLHCMSCSFLLLLWQGQLLCSLLHNVLFHLRATSGVPPSWVGQGKWRKPLGHGPVVQRGPTLWCWDFEPPHSALRFSVAQSCASLAAPAL